MNLTHENVSFLDRGQLFHVTKCYGERFPTSLNQETREASNLYHDFVSHRGITLILFARSKIQLICIYDVYLGVPFRSIA